MLGDLTIQDCKTLATFARGLTLDDAKTLFEGAGFACLYKHVYPQGWGKLCFKDLSNSLMLGSAKLDTSGLVGFRGGPSGREWCQGTALTFVVDCLFSLTVMQGEDYVNDCIHRFFMQGAP